MAVKVEVSIAAWSKE